MKAFVGPSFAAFWVIQLKRDEIYSRPAIFASILPVRQTCLVYRSVSYCTTSALVRTTSSSGTSWCPDLLPVLTLRIASSTSVPDTTFPNTQ